MTEVVEIASARLELAVKRGYRNWKTRFKEAFGRETRFAHLSDPTLAVLARGKDEGTFYLFDLIMSLEHLGSGFEFGELDPRRKIAVMDRYLFLLDRLRYEYMKRKGWLAEYPGEEFSLVELLLSYERLAPRLQAETPILSKDHPAYEGFSKMSAFEREEFIRRLIPEALRELEDQSTTL
ncbi:MAG: hypothetical protein JRH13_07845 [Deltaproteobacteria bacterium]|nr:hypothetical protein [Deltaproteobacteria bacterium]